MKKQYLTLMEVLVAMTLFSVLLTVLFGMYARVNKMQVHADMIQEKVSEYSRAYVRLSNIIPKITLGVDPLGSHDQDEIKEFFFFTAGNSDRGSALEFIYDNGATILPKFSAYVHGRLYVGKYNNDDKEEASGLMLETHPSPAQFPNAKEEIRQEKILANVDKIQLKFIAPEKEYRQQKYPVQNLGQGQTDKQPDLNELPDDSIETDQWSSKSYKTLPAMIQMEIIRYDKDDKPLDPLIWLFDLPLAGYKLLLK